MKTTLLVIAILSVLLGTSAFCAGAASAQSAPPATAANAAEQPKAQPQAVPPAPVAASQGADKTKWEPLPPAQEGQAGKRAEKNRPAGRRRGREGLGRREELRALFTQADADHNGQITFKEAEAAVPDMTKERFTQLDRNGDGVLTVADRTAGPKGAAGPKRPSAGTQRPEGERIRALCQRADKDGNGKVTFEELSAVDPAITRERFSRWDNNKDGVLSEADRADAGADRPNGAEKPQAPGNRRALLKKADANGDRQVTFEELSSVAPNMTQEQFNIMDKDGDGFLTPKDRQEEAPSAPKQDKPADVASSSK